MKNLKGYKINESLEGGGSGKPTRKLKGYRINLEILKGGVLGNEDEMTTAEVNQILRETGTPLANTVQDMRIELGGLMSNAREINAELDEYEQGMANYENIHIISGTEVPNPGDIESLQVELNDVAEMISDLKKRILEQVNESRTSFEVAKKRFFKDLKTYIKSSRNRFDNASDYLQDLLIQIQEMNQNHTGALRYLRAVEIKLKGTGNGVTATQLFDTTYV
jgi:uncharacterized protein YeeX (DUF496 family)